jgi:hypothetical protein
MRNILFTTTAVVSLLMLSGAIAQTEPAPTSPPSIAAGLASSLGITESEAERRLALLEEARQVAAKVEAKIGNRWGGLRVTNNASTFRVEFLITGNADKELDGLTSRPEFVASKVSRSYQGLKNKFDRLLAALKAENIEYEIALLPADNIVEIRHLPNPAARDVLKKFKSLLNDEVRVVETPNLVEVAATIVGGNGLSWSMPANGGAVTFSGTSGYTVNDISGGGRGVTTAAHMAECSTAAASSCGSGYTASSSCRSNTTIRDTRHGVDLTFARQAYAPSQDVELRKASAHKFTNKVTTQGFDYTVASKVNARSYPEGTLVYCKEGTTTRYTCGTVVANNAAFSAGQGGTFIRGQANDASKGIAQGGDSGGPVFVGVSGQPSQLAAIGVTVGAGGALVRACGPRMEHYFMAIQDVESALNVSLATTP